MSKQIPKPDPLRGRTIVAAATAPGTAAVAVVQLAGPHAPKILRDRLASAKPPTVGRIALGFLRDRDGRRVDQVLVSRLTDTPPLYEITCHGGVRVRQRVIEVFREGGAEKAPSNILRDLVHRLDDPVGRDAYALLPRVRTALAAKFLLHQAHHGLAELLNSGHADTTELQRALTYWPAVRYLIDGLTAVIVGPANAGKSTLLNTLAAREQALVTDVPGTTRDYVRADVNMRGLPVTLIDTAGLGHTDDRLADQARRKAIQACELADLALILLDAASPASLTDQFAQTTEIAAVKNLIAHNKTVTLLNKIDLIQQSPFSRRRSGDVRIDFAISATAGTNIDQLEPAIWRTAGLAGFDYRCPTPFTTTQAEMIMRTGR